MQKKELEQLLKRVQADFENYRKRIEQDREQHKKSTNAELILSILPVLDNFKRATQQAPQNSWAQGVKVIERQLEAVLGQHGLQAIEVNPGDQVDPNYHEVVGQYPADAAQKDTVVKLLEQGYKLNDKVLRPAKVIIS